MKASLFRPKSVFVLFVCFFPAPLLADSVQSLIEREKEESTEWMEDDAEAPPFIVLGHRKGVEVYNPGVDTGQGYGLCGSLDLDHLIEVLGHDDTQTEVILNVALPRIRAILEKSCLIRPADVAMAVGPGWQKQVVLKDFILRPDRPLCPRDPPFSLWMSFQNDLEEDPLFYVTDVHLKEGNNNFKKISHYPSLPTDKSLHKALSSLTLFPEDYRIETYQIDAPPCERLLVLERRLIDSEDNGLPNHMLLWQKGDRMQTLHMERVDTKKGTGHIRTVALLNTNSDEWIDIYLKGDHQGCPYSAVFEGTKEGFKAFDLPNKPCECL